jgi:hypothetical protein
MEPSAGEQERYLFRSPGNMIKTEYCILYMLRLPNTKQKCYNHSSTLSIVLLEKLIVTQLVKKFAASYGNRRIIIVFTRARQSPCREPVHSPDPVSLKSIFLLSSHLQLDLKSCSSLQVLQTKSCMQFSSFPHVQTHALLISFSLT